MCENGPKWPTNFFADNLNELDDDLLIVSSSSSLIFVEPMSFIVSKYKTLHGVRVSCEKEWKIMLSCHSIWSEIEGRDYCDIFTTKNNFT